MGPQRLVLFVEGKGDVTAVPNMAGRVVAYLNGNDALFVDNSPFRVSGLGALLKDGGRKWRDLLATALKTRKNLSAVLLVLDGDIDHVPKTWEEYVNRFRSTEFCAARVASSLVDAGRAARAGEAFSLASVFIMKEFEAWLLAGIESLRGTKLADGRGTVPSDVTVPDMDIERPRNIKDELRSRIPLYQETLDQGELARHVDLSQIRQRCKSFRRFESAIRQLLDAARTQKPMVSPSVV